MPDLLWFHLHVGLRKALHSFVNGARAVVRNKGELLAGTLQGRVGLVGIGHIHLQGIDNSIYVTVHPIEGVNKAASLLSAELQNVLRLLK